MELRLFGLTSLLLFLGAVPCEIWCLGKTNAMFESTYITGPLNDSIVFKTFSSRSVLQCSSACHSVDSVSLFYQHSDNICSCNNDTDEAVVSATEDTDINYVRVINSEKVFDFVTYERTHVIPIPIDCFDFYNLGYRQDGVYQIQPKGGDKVDTWCDMANGGWTVIQRRQDGSEDFYRTFEEYVNGFGNRSGEYWLGLENMHMLTLNTSTLRIDMETFGEANPHSAYAEYSTFKVDSSATIYALHIGGYTGNCGDSLISVHNGRPFATKDMNNLCALNFKGAWWYGVYPDCHRSNLNGYYYGGYHTAFGEGVNWKYCWDHNYSLKTTVMKIRRNI